MNKEIVWSRMNLKEVLPELPCPLTLSIFARAERILFIEQFKKMGYSLPEDVEYIRAFYGRLYFNMNIWHKVYSDFGTDPELSQRAFGGFQNDLMKGLEAKPSVFTRMKMVPAYIKTMLLFSNINKISKENFSIIREGYERESNIDMRNLTDREILGYFESIEELSKRDLTVIIGAGTSTSYWYLMEFLKKLVPDEDLDNVLNQLVTSERERNSMLHAPDAIVGDVVPEMIKETVREPKKVFTCYAASPGIVQGRARIIRSPEEFGRFKPGEILVAPTTDPMWSSLFPVAKAVVTEMGGVLSHAAIVAREYGTPCVVNVKGITCALEDGDLIEVDGKNGAITIIQLKNIQDSFSAKR